MNKKCLLCLGNGFDVAHGFKTSYKDFYNGKIEDLRHGAKNGNLLFQHIMNHIIGEYWQDLETGLYKYSIELTKKQKEGYLKAAKQFEDEFIELKKLLFDYLQNPPENMKASTSQSIKELYDEWQRLDYHVVCFNYTYIAAAYTTDSNNQNSGLSLNSKAITYQHGMIINPNPYRVNSYENIVVGIDESQKVEDLHSFLYKANQQLSSISQLLQRVSDCSVYVFFGCSMGDSDKFYFKNLFDKRKMNKHYIVYAYGDEEKKRLNNVIRKYTGELTEFQDEYHNNEIRIIDCKKEKNAVRETKQYIDSILFNSSL